MTAIPHGYVTVPIAFPNMRTGAELVAVPSDIFSSSPTKSQQREHALIERAETAESSLAAANAEIERLREAIFGRVPEPGLPLPFVLEAARLLHAAQREGQASVATLTARVAELKAGLKPFAREASTWADSVPDKHRSLCTEPGSRQALLGSQTKFTVSDLRRARALLQKDKNHG